MTSSGLIIGIRNGFGSCPSPTSHIHGCLFQTILCQFIVHVFIQRCMVCKASISWQSILIFRSLSRRFDSDFICTLISSALLVSVQTGIQNPSRKIARSRWSRSFGNVYRISQLHFTLMCTFCRSKPAERVSRSSILSWISFGLRNVLFIESRSA